MNNLSYIPVALLLSFLIVSSFELTQQVYPKHLLHDNKGDKKITAKIQSNQGLKAESGLIEQVQYFGTFQSKLDKPILNHIRSSSGHFNIIFTYDDSLANNQHPNIMLGFLYDPKYHDGRSVSIQIVLNKTSQTQLLTIYSGSDVNLTYNTFDKQFRQQEKYIQHVSYRIQVYGLETGDESKVHLEVQFVCANEFNFTAHLQYKVRIIRALFHCLYYTAVVALQILSLVFLLKTMEVQVFLGQKLSLTVICFCSIEHMYELTTFVQYCFELRFYSWFFILPALSYFAIFIIFDLKLTILAWKGHYMRQIGNGNQLKKKLAIFYVKFYAAMFMYIILQYFFMFDSWFLILHCFIYLPQIIRNCRLGNTTTFPAFFILGFLGSRILIPLYERGCTDNYFLLTPKIEVVATYISMYIIQISFLFLQSKFGPRFFIPKRFRPGYYNYYVELTRTAQNEHLDCTICLQLIFSRDLTSLAEGSLLSENLLESVKVMRTPCNHIYHEYCLMKWTQVKLECPACRKKLPPIL